MKKFIAAILIMATLFALAPSAMASTMNGWTSKVDYENTDPNRYVIEVDVTNQIITVYGPGSGIVLQSLCTTGSDTSPTGRGTFKLGHMKERFGYFVAYGQYAQYWTQVVRGIYIHSLMYNKQDTSTMSKTAYRNLGKNVSHGCIRVLPDVAKWIYYNCPPGTTCKVVKKAVDAELVKSLKNAMPAYSDYVQPTDTRAWPCEIPATVKADRVPFRTGSSSVNDKTIGYLKKGDHVRLLQIAPDWCKVVKENGDIGYVKSQYLLAYPDAAISSYTADVTTRKTYIYAKKSTDSKKLMTVPKGAEVELIEESGRWWKASYNGVTGYVYAKYIKSATCYIYPTLAGAESTPTAPGTSGSLTVGGGISILGPGGSSSSSGNNSGTSGSSSGIKPGSSSGILGGGIIGPGSTAAPAPTPAPTTPPSNNRGGNFIIIK